MTNQSLYQAKRVQARLLACSANATVPQVRALHQDLQHSCKDCHASGQRHCKSPHNQAIARLELYLSAQALMQSQFSAQRASRSKQLAALNSAIGQWHTNQQKELEAKRWPLIITPCKLVHNGGCL